MAGLSFVTPLAYDFRYAYSAIGSYYDIADEIILGLDRDRMTWSRRPFALNVEELQRFISQIDRAGKIRILEGDFHAQEHPMANEMAERSWLSRQCAAGNWVVQIDADETLLNPGDFRTWMAGQKPGSLVVGRWISVFKTFATQAVVIDPPVEAVPVATQSRGAYTLARWTGEPQVLSPLQLLHLSWGRSAEETRQKLENWGHSKDFDVEAFFRLWESVTLENYHLLKNFHPIEGHLWPGLRLVPLRRGA